MIARRAALSLAAICLAAVALFPTGSQGAAAPAWSLTVTPIPSNFAPGADPEPQYLISATNVGAAPTTSEAALLKAVLPAGLTPTGFEVISTDPNASAEPECEIQGQEISCETEEALHPGRLLLLTLDVAVSAAEGTYETEASVSGGGASNPVVTQFPTQVQAAPLAFGILPGFQAPVSNEDGSATTLAGSHPYQQTVSFGFPTENPGDGQTNDGHPRDFSVELPRGLVGDPAASPVLCTEAELTGQEGCPDASQVGLADVTTLGAKTGVTGISSTPLYNMVPPPGSVAELATDVAEVGLFAHTFAEVRTDSDYGIQAKTPDVLALGTEPIFSVQAQVWGDPSAEAHDSVRGKCTSGKGSCPVARGHTAFLTMPSDCQGRLPYEVNADTWEEPSPPAALHRATYESADLAGNPTSTEECGALEFEPSIKARPTTNLADSPTGLEFNLHQPTDDELGKPSPAILRDTAIRFPAGMAVNPSQAAGLDACSEAQIGFLGKTEAGRLDFSKAPQSCPDASKLGSLEVTTPALVQRNEDHEVEEDPEGNPVLQHLHGTIYIAKPFANPFGSLIAVYLAIEDEKTGIVAKLAGEGELNPQSGQITTRFKESPEMPLQDISVKLFGGPRGALVTPPVCGKFTTESDLTPWSAPEGKDAFPTSSFQTTASPSGGACPTSEAQMPNAPRVSAGTENPTAGAYSPLLFKLSRPDGSQRLGRIEATLPTGVSAKLAGVGECSEADIAKARSREVPEKGALEQADPSCPASSEVGTVIGAAGAGPTPYYTTGHAYLAGPYKGAPISIVSIVPAVAGPFDLGTVVVRAAVYLDPATAQGRIVSDPLPAIVHGVPLDVRSIAVRADRPDFSLNPTSCAEKAFGGQVLSTLGLPAPIFQRFQVGGCASLPFAPRLSAKLFGPTNRGAHPRLKSVFTAQPGEANSAAISFALPRSEFIDQGHFRTICTRVQFAANQCPAGSVYGHITAYSPLLDYPLEGPVYLRSSIHQLPDVVLALHGPAYQPIFLEVPGHVDSVHGGLRVRFESVPDAPLTRAVFTAQGAKKGLFQNSTDICRGTHRATVKLDAQNGRVSDSQPKLVAQCAKKGKGKNGHKGGKHKNKHGGRH
jgi:hypothetical protein